MTWKNEVFLNFKLYAVSDVTNENSDFLNRVEAIYRGGADIVQLRSKNLSDAALYRLGLRIRKIADQHKKLFFVNDRPDLALAVCADGVHLGQDDFPVSVARKLSGDAGVKLWIGKSTHSLEQGISALTESPDYIGVGPIFATPTKPSYAPVGLEYVRQAAEQIKIPFVAIGGITLENLSQVLEAGAKRIAVVRGLFSASDSFTAAQQFRSILEKGLYANAKY